ncbi:MAG: long-chain fatty acid--CoA ligase [Gammaproteobacteria bacterium]|nr:long-chain fatty acid--CoA ligase [Gammaproteobacteria bacterium]
MKKTAHIQAISPETAGTLSGLFFKRVKATPDKAAYHYFDETSNVWKMFTWIEAYVEVSRWQTLLLGFGLKAEDNIAIMLKNCPNWIFAEQAALSLGMVVVPLYTNDRADNIAYILEDADIKLLIVESTDQLESLTSITSQLQRLTALISLEKVSQDYFFQEKKNSAPSNKKTGNELKIPLHYYRDRITGSDSHCQHIQEDPDSLATIVYTSGTTGKPKGVMLSHRNILFDTWAAISAVPCQSNDKFLSFLPLSHMFERTAGYYIPMMAAAEVAFARSIELLAADLQTVKPTVLVTVPRIFERVQEKIVIQLEHKPPLAQKLFNLTVDIGWQRFLYQQHQAGWFFGLLLWPILNKIVVRKVMDKLGGNMRLAISGGAPLANDIARFFIGLGLTITQGYGMTEAGPVISTNKLDDNDPFSVGQILPGIQTRFTEQGELLVKAANVMLGYWHNESATAKILNSQGWLHTGDKAELKNDHLYITGRVKEILVLSNGEKVPPAELEMAICSDPVFEQAMVVGEAKPYLSAIVVLNEEMWSELANEARVNSAEQDVLQNKQLRKLVTEKISNLLASFPGYEQIRRVKLELHPWTIDNGMLTPTMKLKRNKILSRFSEEIDELYAGHS